MRAIGAPVPEALRLSIGAPAAIPAPAGPIAVPTDDGASPTIGPSAGAATRPRAAAPAAVAGRLGAGQLDAQRRGALGSMRP